MIFCGGVVCFLEKKFSYFFLRLKRVYCFLFFLFEINFLVYVNGYFVLDYVVRRGLWRDDENCGGYWSDWNYFLL